MLFKSKIPLVGALLMMGLSVPILALAATYTGGDGGLGTGVGVPEPVPFVCTGEAFTVRSSPSDFFQINQNEPLFVFDRIGDEDLGINVNNIGYRLKDNLIYGVQLDSNNIGVGLVKIDKNGDVFDVATNPLVSSLNQNFAAGDIDNDRDVMYISHFQLRTYIHEVDLSTGVVAKKNLITNGHAGKIIADWAVNPNDNALYGADGNRCVNGSAAVYKLDPVALTVTSLGGIPGLPCSNHNSPAYGGAWFDAQGNLFVYQNGPDKIYQVDLTNKVVADMQEGAAGSSNQNDATACAAGVPLIDKFYTYTNNNWDPVCINEVQDTDADGNPVVNDDGTPQLTCLEYEAANIESGDVFADNLPTNENGDFILYGQLLGKKTAVTPGQYIAVSEITNPKEQDITIKEDFSDCVDSDGIGVVNPNSVPGGVQVVLVSPDGYVDPIGGDLSNNIGGYITLTEEHALIHVEDVPAGYTLRVMVKFQPFNDLDMIGRSCTNHEILLDENGDEISRDSAVLRVEEKPQ